MSLILENLYDALISAKVPEEQARAAAREVAQFENRLSKIDADVTLLKWMVGFNLTASIAVLFLLFNVMSRLPK